MKNALRTILGLTLIAPIMIVWSLGVASASGTNTTCTASIGGTTPTSYTDNMTSTGDWTLQCTHIPNNSNTIEVIIPNNSGYWSMLVIGTLNGSNSAGSFTQSVSGTGCQALNNVSYNYNLPNEFLVDAKATSSADTCSPDVSISPVGWQWNTSTSTNGFSGLGTSYGPSANSYTTALAAGTATPILFYSWYNNTSYNAGDTASLASIFGVIPPCTLAGVYGDNTTTGQAFGYSLHTYAFYLESAAPVIDIIAPESENTGYSTGTPADYVASSTPSGAMATGAPTYFTSGEIFNYFTNNQQAAYSVGTTDPPATARQDVQVDYSTATSGSIPTNLEAYCWSPSSGWVDWGNLLSISLAPGAKLPGSGTPPTSPKCTYSSIAQPCDGSGGGTGSFAPCVAADAIGLSPASWVPGLINMGGCAVQALFVPSSSKVTALANSFGVTSNTPTPGADSASQWLGSVGYMLTVGPSAGAGAIQTCIASGCSAPAITTGISVHAGAHTYSVDAPSALTAVATSDGSWSTTLVDILAAALLVAFFIEIARLLRKTTGSTE